MVTNKTHTKDTDTFSTAETDRQALGGLESVSMVIRGDALFIDMRELEKQLKVKLLCPGRQ